MEALLSINRDACGDLGWTEIGPSSFGGTGGASGPGDALVSGIGSCVPLDIVLGVLLTSFESWE